MKFILGLNIVFALLSPLFFFFILPGIYASEDRGAGILTMLIELVWYGLIGGILIYFSSRDRKPSLFFVLPILYAFTFMVVWMLSVWQGHISDNPFLYVVQYSFPILYIVYLPAVGVSFLIRIAVSLSKRMTQSV